ncbi:branched-chain amino acid ABC transporter permease [Hydrogenibacillus sp. N12]|uniref:Branched-chain amino acid ABC transporter permease n=1 Tax=Hydrogenibacillus schlegelii TaxID=1484 RepID=A0A947D495_HYDSH|nr:branched-chain amino acid ABC transporter permease [Hydrogenibacillus sp. N12]MBT9282513.1 branched-chain amino acid ABC transporter permease [Hydrogenibacillus schlegelii]QZA31986.1 branched-chain amino acid ABC transporter permease [Hydrogenibacillus sp. N12]
MAARRWGVATAVFGLVAFPFVFSENNYFLSLMILIGLYGLMATGLLLLMGYAGQVSLGHAAFFGLGAYTSAYLTARLGWPPVAALLMGVGLSLAVAFVIGLAALRLREHYLALATLGFGVIMYTVFKNAKAITGGLDGFFGIPPFSVGPVVFTGEGAYYALVWGTVVFGLWFAANVLHSRAGRAIRALHDSEFAAEALGVNVFRAKLDVFLLSAAYASVAGSLYAHYVGFINPQLFDLITSITLVAMVIIGGNRAIMGGVLGAGVYVVLGEGLKAVVPKLIPTAGGEFELLFFGLLIIVIMIFKPEGLTGFRWPAALRPGREAR